MLRISVIAASLLLAVPALAGGIDYNVTPLTQADVDLYMSIMRAAAQHNTHLTGDDKAAVAYAVSLQKTPPKPRTGMPSAAEIKQMERNAQLAARSADLASYDEVIAKQRNVEARYDGIKSEVEQVYARSTGLGLASCGGDDCGGKLTAAQIAMGKKTEAALKADEPLVKPHVAEIKTLKRQIGGFMFGQAL
ncbi:MAG: hypothetical protein ACTHLR_03005 [Rhizomicrobium sp.]